MAAQEYKVKLPNGKTAVVWANSAEQAARRVEKQNKVSRVRQTVSNVTHKQAV